MIFKGVGLAVIALTTAAIATGTNAIPEVSKAAESVRTRLTTAVDQDATGTSQTDEGCEERQTKDEETAPEDSGSEERQTKDEEKGPEDSGSEERQTRDEEAED